MRNKIFSWISTDYASACPVRSERVYSCRFRDRPVRDKKIFRISLYDCVPFFQWVVRKKEIKRIFVQTAFWPPLGSRGQKKTETFVKTALSSPVGSEERKFQISSSKCAARVQREMRKKISKSFDTTNIKENFSFDRILYCDGLEPDSNLISKALMKNCQIIICTLNKKIIFKKI